MYHTTEYNREFWNAARAKRRIPNATVLETGRDTQNGSYRLPYESNKKYMEKGVEVWKNKEIINRFPDLRYNPIVADLLCEIGRANGAPDLLDKGTPHTEKKTNPLDRFGIGIDELM